MTFDEWYADFQTRYYKGEFSGQRKGQAFVNALYTVKPDIPNALAFMKCDPFYTDDRLQEAVDFASRVW